MTQSLLSGTPHILVGESVSPLHLQLRLWLKSLHHLLLLQNWLSRLFPWDPAGLPNGFEMYQTQELVTRLKEASIKALGFGFAAW